MDQKRRTTLKRILNITLWCVAGVGLFVLLLSAMKRNDALKCSGIDITIAGYNNEMFISVNEVKERLVEELGQPIVGSPLASLNLRKLENALHQDPWIKDAQLYIDAKQMLHVNIGERMPVARVFTRTGQSFYLDSTAVMLPLSQNEIADVPVFTNVPDDVPRMAAPDSMLWQQVSHMGSAIKRDSFLLMQIGQVDITPNAGFVMYPAIGEHVVQFGTADKYEEKLRRLSLFYRKVLGKVGLNKYAVVDLRFDKQVVATLKGTPDVKVDPDAAVKAFEAMVAQTIREANDTTLRILPDKPLRQGPAEVEARSLDAMGTIGGNDTLNNRRNTTTEQNDRPKAVMPPKKN